MKNIIFFAPGPKYNIEQDFKSRCELLSRNFSGWFFTSGPSSEEKFYENFGVKCFKDSLGKRTLTYIKMFFSALALIFRARSSGRPVDLLISYDPLKTGVMATILGKLTKTKVIVEVNGCYDNPWIYHDISNPVHKMVKRRACFAFEKFSLKRAQGIKLLFEEQISEFPTNDGVVDVFPDFVDGSPFYNLDEQKVILLAGFPFYIKGVDILIAAFRELAHRYPDWSVKILGFYPDKSLLKDAIDGCEQIEVHEPVDHSQMPYHIGTCAVLVLPSRTEAMGRVLLEAAAASKARIGSRVGGIPTVINDGEDGVLVEPEDIEDLRDKLEDLMNSSMKRTKYGEKANERYRVEFSMEKYLERTVSFYDAVLGAS